jgi:hypothetical protein
MRLIEFTHTGHSAVFGSFSAGDRLRCGPEAARHFVEEARCARYADSAPELPSAADSAAAADASPPAEAAPATSEPKPAAKRAKKA